MTTLFSGEFGRCYVCYVVMFVMFVFSSQNYTSWVAKHLESFGTDQNEENLVPVSLQLFSIHECIMFLALSLHLSLSFHMIWQVRVFFWSDLSVETHVHSSSLFPVVTPFNCASGVSSLDQTSARRAEYSIGLIYYSLYSSQFISKRINGTRRLL